MRAKGPFCSVVAKTERQLLAPRDEEVEGRKFERAVSRDRPASKASRRREASDPDVKGSPVEVDGGSVSLRKRSKTMDYSILNGKWGFSGQSRTQEEACSENKAKKKQKCKPGKPTKSILSAGSSQEGSAGETRSSADAATALRVKIKSKLSRARYLENMLDAYQQEGWGGRGHRQLKPTAELAKCSQQLAEVKASIRTLLEALDPDPKISRIAAHEIRIPEKAYQHDGVEVDKVTI